MLDHSSGTPSSALRAVALTCLAVSLLAVTGCSSTRPTTGSETTGAETTGAVTPGAETTPPATSTSPAPGAPGPITAGRMLGDAVAVSSVTDALGTYAHVGLSPQAKAAAFDPALVDPDSEKGLFDAARLASAQRWVTGFIASETLDSPALDVARNYPAWSARAEEDSVAPGGSALLDAGTDGTNAITWNAAGTNIVPRLIRDGGPRMTRETVDVTRVYPFTDGGPGPAIAFFVTAEADYRVSDEAARAYVEARDPTDSAATRERKTVPALYDGTGENSFPVKGTLVYSVVQRGSSWRIAGVKVTYDTPQTWQK